MWNILNTIIKTKGNLDNYPKYFIENEINMEEAANSFNRFFSNVGSDLAAKIPELKKGERQVRQLTERNPRSMFLQQVDEFEIIGVVRKFKNKMSTDYNDLDMTLIKDVINLILKPLVHIFNLSLITGTVPNSMKIAKVIPLFKSGDDDNQYGFRQNRSTALAVIDSTEEITHCIDEKKIIAGLFLDIKKSI